MSHSVWTLAEFMIIATFRWTHIIDSLGLIVPDEAYFEKLPNGDDLEIGTTACPHKNGAMTDYEEVWGDITSKLSATELSWILQSKDGRAFLGKVGATYLAMEQATDGAFAVRREDREASGGDWGVSYSSGAVDGLPTAIQAIEALEKGGQNWAEGQAVEIGAAEYVFRAVDTQ